MVESSSPKRVVAGSSPVSPAKEALEKLLFKSFCFVLGTSPHLLQRQLYKEGAALAHL